MRPLLLLCLALAGCAAPMAPPPASPFGGPVTVTGRLAQPGSPYRLAETDGFRPWQPADVDHLAVFIRRAGGSEVALGAHPDPQAPLVIGNLRMDTSYEVRLEAYTAGGTRIDADDATCVTPFATTTATSLELDGAAALRLRLADRVFAGTADADLAITGGAIVGTAEDETLDITRPQGLLP